MKILLAHGRLSGQGGAERYIREIGAPLAEHGHRLEYLTTQGEAVADWVNGGIHTIPPSLGWRSGRRKLDELQRILAAAKPDLIYIHNLKAFLSPLLVDALIRSAPSVFFVHDVRLFCPNETKIIPAGGHPCAAPSGIACLKGNCCRLAHETPLEAWRRSAYVLWQLRVCRRAERFVAPSQYIAGELARNGVRPERITVLPYFTERRPPPKPPDPDGAVLWVGRFDGTKGFDSFARMLAALGRESCRAAVVGDGAGLEAARRLVESLGISSRVSFLGRLGDRDLDSWYSRSRIVVLTSMVAESFCMVGVEAMAHGRPVVAFDVGGIREWLEDDATGLAVRPGDISALAAAVRGLLDDPRLAARFGERGRALVDSRFRLSSVLPGLLSTFDEARRERNGLGRRALVGRAGSAWS